MSIKNLNIEIPFELWIRLNEFKLKGNYRTMGEAATVAIRRGIRPMSSTRTPPKTVEDTL